MPSMDVLVQLDGRRVRVVNEHGNGVFPQGTIAEGLLLWHLGSRQWIIREDPADSEVQAVGGCSGGPEVIDLVDKVYWTC